ncbi:hypothetical protein PO909_011314 [Leuciscus waleckii]
MYISQMDTYPLIIGKDLLDHFEPLLDLKHLNVWAQVQKPLPLQPHKSAEPDGLLTGFMGTPADTAPLQLKDAVVVREKAATIGHHLTRSGIRHRMERAAPTPDYQGRTHTQKVYVRLKPRHSSWPSSCTRLNEM